MKNTLEQAWIRDCWTGWSRVHNLGRDAFLKILNDVVRSHIEAVLKREQPNGESMKITLEQAGTPDQPVIPAGETATIDLSEAPVPDPNNPESIVVTDLGTLNVPSSAGLGRDAYFKTVNDVNGSIFPNQSTDPGDVFKATTLTDAWEQEFNTNPASGHNDPNI